MISRPREIYAPKHTQSKVTGIAKAKWAYNGFREFDLHEPTDLLRRRLAAASAGADEVTE